MMHTTRLIFSAFAPVVAVAALAAPSAVGTASANQPVAPASHVIDRSDRDAVARWYLEDLAPALGREPNWTGSTETCSPGAVDAHFHQSEIAALNAVRAYSGLSAVREKPELTARAQQAATMMLANKSLSHTPPETWACWTPEGSAGAKSSNLYYGATGAEAILGYLRDSCPYNASAGHRRWLLYPPLAEVGLGDTSRTNAVTLFGGQWGADAQQWVAWPAQGYFPEQLWPGGTWGDTARWSLSYPGADFSEATVDMTRDGVAIDARVNREISEYGDPAITWQVDSPIVSGQDARFSVTVRGVRLAGGQMTEYRYDTVVFDPTNPSPVDPSAPAPSQVQARVEAATGAVTVTWAPAPTGGALSVPSYEVRAASGRIVCSTAGELSCDVTGLRLGRKESFSVQAVYTKSRSLASTPSAEVLVAKVPGIPRLTTLRCSGAVCTARWGRAAAGGVPILRYEYRVQGQVEWTQLAGLRTRFHRPQETSVSISVRAVNSMGDGQPDSMTLP